MEMYGSHAYVCEPVETRLAWIVEAIFGWSPTQPRFPFLCWIVTSALSGGGAAGFIERYVGRALQLVAPSYLAVASLSAVAPYALPHIVPAIVKLWGKRKRRTLEKRHGYAPDAVPVAGVAVSYGDDDDDDLE
jgi:hypothetical protein